MLSPRVYKPSSVYAAQCWLCREPSTTVLDINRFVNKLIKRLDETIKRGHETPHGEWEKTQPHAGPRRKQPSKDLI